jgi:hypothetical protein
MVMVMVMVMVVMVVVVVIMCCHGRDASNWGNLRQYADRLDKEHCMIHSPTSGLNATIAAAWHYRAGIIL